MSLSGPILMALGAHTDLSVPGSDVVGPGVGRLQERPRSYYFGIRGLPQTGLDRTINYRWEAQNRVGRRPAMQFLGIGEETVSLKGIIYPPNFGSFDQLEQMRDEAGRGFPRGMITSYGRYYGVWCIRGIRDSQGPWWPDGGPRRVEFTIDLVHYGPDGFTGGGIFA